MDGGSATEPVTIHLKRVGGRGEKRLLRSPLSLQDYLMLRKPLAFGALNSPVTLPEVSAKPVHA